MDGGAWWAAVHGVAKSRTRLSDFTFTFHFHALEKEMATHSSVFAWRIPGTAEPGGLPSLGSHRVGHDWSDLAAAAMWTLGFLGGSVVKNLPANCQCRGQRFDPLVRKILWRRKWQPSPVFLSEEFHGQRSLVGYHPWGHKGLDMTWRLRNNHLQLALPLRKTHLFLGKQRWILPQQTLGTCWNKGSNHSSHSLVRPTWPVFTLEISSQGLDTSAHE